ncbi:MAG: hypothetical protein ACRCXH_08805, partial [Shewanella sp.]
MFELLRLSSTCQRTTPSRRGASIPNTYVCDVRQAHRLRQNIQCTHYPLYQIEGNAVDIQAEQLKHPHTMATPRRLASL